MIWERDILKKTIFLFILLFIIVNVYSKHVFLRSKHFNYYINDNYKEYVEDIVSIAESSIDNFSEITGKPLKRIDVFIKDFSEMSRGEADPVKQTIDINIFIDKANFSDLKELFKHELIHVLHFQNVQKGKGGLKYLIELGFVPLWFYEGYAESFSKEENPFYYSQIHLFSEYSINELNLFYFRDQFNRWGGYFYSDIFIRYLKDIYGSKYTWDFISKMSGNFSFTRNFKKHFGDKKEILQKSIAHYKRKYPLRFDERSKNMFDKYSINSSLRKYNNKFLYLTNRDKDFGMKDLIMEDKILFKNVHSYNVSENSILLSIMDKETKKHRIFEYKDKNLLKTRFYGIYPDENKEYFVYQDFFMNIFLYKNNKLIKKIKGEKPYLNNEKLYFFDPIKKEINCYYPEDDFIKKIYNYNYTSYALGFSENEIYTVDYIEGSFYVIKINFDKKDKVFEDIALDIFMDKNIIYYTTIRKNKKAIMKRDLYE